MHQDSQDRIKEIEKKIMLMGILDTSGIFMMALWAYTKFVANGNPFHPLLNNQAIVSGLFIVGGVTIGLCAIQVVRLSLEKSRIIKERNL